MDSETKDAIHNLELAVKELAVSTGRSMSKQNIETSTHLLAFKRRLEELERLSKNVHSQNCNREGGNQVGTVNGCVTPSGTVENKPQNSSVCYVEYINIAEAWKKGKLAGLKFAYNTHDSQSVLWSEGQELIRKEIAQLESELK